MLPSTSHDRDRLTILRAFLQAKAEPELRDYILSRSQGDLRTLERHFVPDCDCPIEYAPCGCAGPCDCSKCIKPCPHIVGARLCAKLHPEDRAVLPWWAIGLILYRLNEHRQPNPYAERPLPHEPSAVMLRAKKAAVMSERQRLGLGLRHPADALQRQDKVNEAIVRLVSRMRNGAPVPGALRMAREEAA